MELRGRELPPTIAPTAANVLCPDAPKGDTRLLQRHRVPLSTQCLSSAEREDMPLQSATICRWPLRGPAHRSHPCGKLPNTLLARKMRSECGPGQRRSGPQDVLVRLRRYVTNSADLAA